MPIRARCSALSAELYGIVPDMQITALEPIVSAHMQ